MALRARDVMTTRVVTVGPDDTIADAVRRMGELRVMPVAEHGVLVGASRAATCCAAAPGRARSGDCWSACAARTRSSRAARAARRASPIGSARLLLVAGHGLRTVPVVEDGRLVGVLSRSDLV